MVDCADLHLAPISLRGAKALIMKHHRLGPIEALSDVTRGPLGENRKRMTIEERLERLTERHQVLTLNVESTARAQRESAEQWDSRFKNLLEMGERTDRRIGALLNMIQGHEKLGKLKGEG